MGSFLYLILFLSGLGEVAAHHSGWHNCWCWTSLFCVLSADMVACCVGGFVSVTFKSIMCILYVEGLLGVVCGNRSGQLVCAVFMSPSVVRVCVGG